MKSHVYEVSRTAIAGPTYWVLADSKETVLEAIKDTGAHLEYDEVRWAHPIAIDFKLPADSASLREALKG